MVALASLTAEVTVTDRATAVLDRVTGAMDRAAAAEGRLQDGVEKTDQKFQGSTRSLESSARGFERLKAASDSVYAKQQQLADAQTKLNRAVELGVASAVEAAEVYTRMERQINGVAAAEAAFRRDLEGVRNALDSGYAASQRLAQQQAVLNQALKQGDITARQYAQMMGEANRQHEVSVAGASKVSGGMGQILGVARQLVPILSVVYAVDKLKDMTAGVAKAGDEWTAMSARVGQAGGSMAQAYSIAQRTGTALGDTVGGMQRLGLAAKEVGATGPDVARLTETVLKLGAVGHASTQELSAGLQQLGQALASGRLGGDELKSIMEGMPTLAKAIADGLGVSVGRLREMGAAGMLTADRVFPAIIAASKSADEQFARLPPTLEQAGVRMANAFARAGAAIDKSIGLSKLLAQGMKAVADAADALADKIEGGPKARIRELEAELANLKMPATETGSTRGTMFGVAPGYVDQSRAVRQAAVETELALRKYQDFEEEFAKADNELWDRTAGKQIAAIKKMNDGIGELHKGLGLVMQDGRLMTTEQLTLEKATLAVNAAIAESGAGLKLLGGSAQSATALLEQLRAKLDPVAGAIKAMADEAALLKIPEGFARDLEGARQALLNKPGVKPEDLGGVPAAVSGRNTARVEDLARQTEAEAAALGRQAKAAGDSAAAMREAKRVNDLVAQGLKLDLTPEQQKFLVQTGRVPGEVSPALDALRELDKQGRAKGMAEGKIEMAGWSASARAAVTSAQLLAEAAGKGEAAQRAAAAAGAVAAEQNNRSGEAAKQRALEDAAVLRITNETVLGLDRDTEANLRMAAAVMQGTEAVEAENRAQFQRQQILKIGTDRTKELTAAMEAYDRNQASKKVVATSTTQVRLGEDIAQTKAMTEAIRAGGEALFAAKGQQDLWNAAKAAGYTSIEKYIAALPEEAKLVRQLTQANREQAAAQLIAGQKRDITVAQAELALANELPEVRQRELTLLKAKLQIMDAFPEAMADERAAALQNAETLANINDQLRVRNEIEAKGKEIAQDVTTFLVDGFVNVEKGGKSAFSNIWSAALAGGKRFLANLAAEALVKPIVVQFATPAVGAAAPIFGINDNDEKEAA